MFRIELYSITENGSRVVHTERCVDCSIEKLDLNDVAFVIVEDYKIQMKRYIFSIRDKAKFVKNNVSGLYKSVMLFGKEEDRSWVHIINYCDAEIFSADTENVLKMLEIIVESSKKGIAFWKVNNLIKEYAEKAGVVCYTRRKIE